ncbi:hypothetical protein NDU88_002987 [Pleurodeles waltl]|uniref:Uncharacterized protein n=1 Tax=Pleurodeles waltl TaxID=8319 RepID=A0AAV7TNC4_PLEWA|nr:hypothetical protein NDU88_002987 [Pleurodeles waltl]
MSAAVRGNEALKKPEARARINALIKRPKMIVERREGTEEKTTQGIRNATASGEGKREVGSVHSVWSCNTEIRTYRVLWLNVTQQ